MGRLIVAEKSRMAKAIAAALGIQKTAKGYFDGGGVRVTWCVGHLVEAVNPEGYDPSLKPWVLGALPILPDSFRFRVIERTRDQFHIVKGLLDDSWTSEVVNACDAGREGELIFDLTYTMAECRKPVLRLWTSSLTEDAIQAAYQSMKPGPAYQSLREAAHCRMRADWLVGINCTRAQTLVSQMKGGLGVSNIGRVVTPTLALLVDREHEIKNFKPRDYWTVIASVVVTEGMFIAKWFKRLEDKEIDQFASEAEARALVDRVSGKMGKILSAEGKTVEKKSEKFYDLTSLQKEANRRFGFTAERTLALAQELYEAKVMSYPRTNSRHLTHADFAKVPTWIQSLAQHPTYAPYAGQLLKLSGLPSLGKDYVNDAEVEDHTAVMPTEKPALNLSGDQAKLYDLVARRLLAAFFPPRVERKTTVVAGFERETFRARGTVVLALGWSEVDPSPRGAGKADVDDVDGDGESTGLPKVASGDSAQASPVNLKAGKTKPPSRMTEADLLDAMQKAGNDLDDESLRGAMKDHGLGTPATRAATIEKLIAGQEPMAVREKKGKADHLVPTPKGIQLIRDIPVQALKSPQLTGEWEASLEQIRRGDLASDEFMARVRSFVGELVAGLRGQAPENPVARPRFEPKQMGICPSCGKDLFLKSWEGKFYVKCSAPKEDKCWYGFDAKVDGSPERKCKKCPDGKIKSIPGKGRVCTDCNQWEDTAGSRGKGHAPSGRRPRRA